MITNVTTCITLLGIVFIMVDHHRQRSAAIESIAEAKMMKSDQDVMLFPAKTAQSKSSMDPESPIPLNEAIYIKS